MEFYNKINELCDSSSISRRKMCEQIGLSYNTYNSMIRRQSRNITFDVIEKIAMFFNVSVDYLIRDEIIDPAYGMSESPPATIPTLTDQQILIAAYTQLTPDRKKTVLEFAEYELHKQNTSEQSVSEGKSSVS